MDESITAKVGNRLIEKVDMVPIVEEPDLSSKVSEYDEDAFFY